MKVLRLSYGEEQPASVESMLDTLLANAIYSAGLSPRDVYKAMFHPQGAKEMARVIVSPQALEDAIYTLQDGEHFYLDSPEVARSIVCVYPESFQEDGSISWCVGFKSRLIGKTVSERLVAEQFEEAYRLYRIFKNVPNARSMADPLLEPLVDCLRERGMTITDGPVDQRWRLFAASVR